MSTPVLSVESLGIDVLTRQGWVRAVDDVSIAVGRGQIHGIVGESGSGKTLTSLAITGLLPRNSARVSGGRVILEGTDLLSLSASHLSKIQGRDLAMVFQEPMTSLNPAFRVGNQIGESIRYHQGASKKQARAQAIALLDEVGIAGATRRIDDYPHQFSGGMRQRIMLAIALACGPKLLIADEPTTALDVTVQAQILELIRRLAVNHDMGVLFITHDLGVVAEICDLVTVLYGGEVVERTDVTGLFSRPQHPYTEGLLASIHTTDDQPLGWIAGDPPRPGAWPFGCRFAPRCAYAAPECVQPISLATGADGHEFRCCRTAQLTLSGRS